MKLHGNFVHSETVCLILRLKSAQNRALKWALKPTLVLACALPAATCVTASAATIVSWGEASDIVGGFTNLSASGTGQTTISFSNGYSSPAVGANYYPNNAGKTPSFYGAGNQTTSSTETPSATTNGTRAISNATPDTIQFGGQNTSADTNKVVTTSKLLLWTSNEFLTSDNELSGMSLINLDNGSTVFTQNRFVIQLGSSYYISQNFGENPTAATTVGFTDPTLVSWFDYDPTVDISAINAAAVISDFSNLTKAGFFSTGTSTAASASVFVQNNTRFFEVTAVPEPTVFALVGAAAAAMLVFRSRKRA